MFVDVSNGIKLLYLSITFMPSVFEALSKIFFYTRDEWKFFC